MTNTQDNESAAVNLNLETIRFIIDKAHAFQVMVQADDNVPVEEADPAYAELRATIEDLEPDQQVSLVGLMWLGRGDFGADEWDQALAAAGESWNERTADYLISTPLLSDYLSEGLNQLEPRPE